MNYELIDKMIADTLKAKKCPICNGPISQGTNPKAYKVDCDGDIRCFVIWYNQIHISMIDEKDSYTFEAYASNQRLNNENEPNIVYLTVASKIDCGSNEEVWSDKVLNTSFVFEHTNTVLEFYNACKSAKESMLFL